ncbi:glycine cleavage system protein H [Carbonactinospora thermoautotrophica]|uniref:Glycine cleavage system H protein n=1 Tax=Carbonactinospora thermoautotrophica TaxID=1469144 RepID=A0A132NFU8_9ACTN|nr:glycine cleavage system protein GcvH [Carbonactinospora thermoautotrophica]KWX01358.1 Glycine cleavage system H protein [Carbonactinospora thermoautotrophica]KWX05696.1 glycine cleavage system H protein [Carbonactinospora thermoautotrophica]KWX09015.1 glycine cleavage system H protein [Carbonactinospora thermoautotrophica]MCX9192806.1 glycine cleavage system protein H [Carbonactinospora thermoautotrophica]
MYPEDLRYTREHEWVRDPGEAEGSVRVGITDYAQHALGDIVFVTLPEVGAEVTAGERCGELESTKSVSDLYAPVSGTVVARNTTLDATPEVINSDPYGEGWMIEIKPSDPAQLEQLLNAAEYQALLDSG